MGSDVWLSDLRWSKFDTNGVVSSWMGFDDLRIEKLATTLGRASTPSQVDKRLALPNRKLCDLVKIN